MVLRRFCGAARAARDVVSSDMEWFWVVPERFCVVLSVSGVVLGVRSGLVVVLGGFEVFLWWF